MPQYAELIVPLTRSQILDTWIAILQAAGTPTDSWGPTDEPRATIEGASEVMVDASTMIAEIGKMGVVGTTSSNGATGKALELLGQDWFNETKVQAVTCKGAVTLTESAGSPHTYAARDLMFVSTADPSLVYYNESSFTLSASSTSSPTIVAESPGAAYNKDSSTLQLATPIAGVTLSAASGTTWITTAGQDEESDESFRSRLRAKAAVTSTTATGAADGYKYHARKASPSVTRVYVDSNPGADQTIDESAVLVYVAGPTGPIGASELLAVTSYVHERSPVGILVSVLNAATQDYELRGDITIKTGRRAAVESAVHSLLSAWFAGNTISINGESVEGLTLGSTIRVSQIIEIILSVPGVVSFVPKDGTGAVRVPGSGDISLAVSTVATLTLDTVTNWTWTEV